MKCKKSDILSECEYSKDNCFGYKRGELMDYKHLIRFFLQKLKKDNIGAYAAQAALFIIMSAIPFLLVFLSLLRFTPVSESTVLSVIQMVLPGQIKITPMLINVVNEVYTNSAKMLPIAVIFAVYSAAKSIQSLRYFCKSRGKLVKGFIGQIDFNLIRSLQYFLSGCFFII